MKKRVLFSIASCACGLFFGSTNLYSESYCEPNPVCGPKLVDTNNYGVMFGACGQETKKLIFCGLIQTDYNFIRVEDDMAVGALGGNNAAVTSVVDPTDRNNFIMRRVRVGFDAYLGNGWKGVVVMDFEGVREKTLYEKPSSGDDLTTTNTFTTTRNKHGIFGIYNAYVEKYYGGNAFRAGYKKVRFGREEYLHDSELVAIERSIASEYFIQSPEAGNVSGSPLGMGSKHVGLFMDGKYNHVGYGFAVVNGFQGNALSDIKYNELGIFGHVYFAGEFNCIDVEVGVHAGYKPKGNNKTLSAVHNYSGQGTQQGKRGSIGVINPYIMASWQQFSVLAEFLGSDVEHGAVDATTDAKPYGFTIMPSFMVNEQLELVGRYSYLDTDFRGARICSIVPGAPDTTSIVGAGTDAPLPSSTTGDIYDNASAWYAGLNYYMMNKAVKFSAGYEYLQFKDRLNPGSAGASNTVAQTTQFTGDKSRAHVVRARIQLVF